MTPVQWVAENYPTAESAKLKCAEATEKMEAEFGFKRIRGHVMIDLNMRPHWWCVDDDGEIIDPTAHQWECRPAIYEPFDEAEGEPHGKCINCGSLLFRSRGDSSFKCSYC